MRHFCNDLVQLSNTQSFPELGVWLIPAQGKILSDGIVEQCRMLKHSRHMLPKAGEPDALYRDTVDQYLTLLRGVDTKNNLDEGGFAAATGAHQSNLLPWCQIQVDAPEHLLVTVTEMDVLQRQPHCVFVPERILQRGITGLFLQFQQTVDTPQGGIGSEPGVLHVEHFLHRRQHEPQVAENGEHHADTQVTEQHRHHCGRAKGIHTELEQGKAGTGGGIAAPFELDSVVPDGSGPTDQLAQVMLFPVGSAQLVDGVQGFSQVALEILISTVFLAFQFLDPFADQHGCEDHQRVEHQDQQSQLPVHPHQHQGSSGNGQARHQETADGGTEELVNGIQVGNEVAGDTTGAAGFILRHGHPLQPAQQARADAEYHILGDFGKFPGLQHIEGQRKHP